MVHKRLEIEQLNDVKQHLAHWGRDKIAAISQTTFSDALSWIKMHEFSLRFHWNLFLSFELTIFQYWFRWWLGADQATSQYLNKWWLVYWRSIYASLGLNELTHWGRVTHICIGNLTIIGSDNGLSPGRRQAIIWTSAGILLIGPLGTNFSEILLEIHTFPLKKIRLKMSSAKCCSFRLGLNVLTHRGCLWVWLQTIIRTNARQF